MSLCDEASTCRGHQHDKDALAAILDPLRLKEPLHNVFARCLLAGGGAGDRDDAVAQRRRCVIISGDGDLRARTPQELLHSDARRGGGGAQEEAHGLLGREAAVRHGAGRPQRWRQWPRPHSGQAAVPAELARTNARSDAAADTPLRSDRPSPSKKPGSFLLQLFLDLHLLLLLAFNIRNLLGVSAADSCSSAGNDPHHCLGIRLHRRRGGSHGGAGGALGAVGGRGNSSGGGTPRHPTARRHRRIRWPHRLSASGRHRCRHGGRRPCSYSSATGGSAAVVAGTADLWPQSQSRRR
mmetsp:Transcript_52033/g.131522  ORF Transcript_52033/g.131522 Transcript_52033/m.131522 type:complete len:296 (-) Transcript_52033:703-1590(-)